MANLARTEANILAIVRAGAVVELAALLRTGDAEAKAITI